MSRLDQTHNLPIFQKAQLIHQLVESLVASLPEEDEYIQATKNLMLEDVMMMTSKIAGAEGGDLYSIRMQNAAIIRDYAMHLYVQVGSFRFVEAYKDLEYVTLIRHEIENFRKLFIEWVAGFDKNNHIWDEWELFNPPGAIAPSDDESNEGFNIDDFLDDEDQ